MSRHQSLDIFIARLAKRMARVYPSNCADELDYIQTGYLKLAEINNDKFKKRDFLAYAIVTIARAMRETALGAMCIVSAPHRIKMLAYRAKMLLAMGKTDKEVCGELQITGSTLASLRSLITTESFHKLFNEQIYDPEPFSVLDDLLSSDGLTEQDRIFMRTQLNDSVENLELSRKQRWRVAKNIRPKLVRGGYGETN